MSINLNKTNKIYGLYGIDTAVNMLRPGATWEITNDKFTVWEDPRPCPTMEEVWETMEKIKSFEDSINVIWLPEHLEALKNEKTMIENALEDNT